MATYWVEVGHGGTDSGTETNPWLLLASAFAAVAAGDHVWVKGGTVYPEAITPTTNGASSLPITFEGWTSTTGDGGQFTLDGAGTRTNGITGFSCSYYMFINMIIDDYTGSGFNCNSVDYCQFRNCEFTNNGSYGILVDNTCIFFECKINNNSGTGLDCDQNNVLVGCEINNNGVYGALFGIDANLAYSSIFAGNAARAITGKARVLNCTIDGENGASSIGIYVDSITKVIINSIIYDCSWGINSNVVSYISASLGVNNLVNSNGADYTNWPTLQQETDITDAPGFTDEAAGDYTLASTSAARNAGADNSGTSSPGMDIGAHQSEDAGGGDRTIITG